MGRVLVVCARTSENAKGAFELLSSSKKKKWPFSSVRGCDKCSDFFFIMVNETLASMSSSLAVVMKKKKTKIYPRVVLFIYFFFCCWQIH